MKSLVEKQYEKFHSLIDMLNKFYSCFWTKEIKRPSSFFPQEKTKVLVVGTFHFDYPGLDVHKTEEGNKIDVLKEPKKSEVTELVNYIKRFKPTKIAISK